MHALEITDLTKVYDDGTEALADLSLVVPDGGFHGLLGPNGSGKSTLIGIVTGLVRGPAGHVRVFGHDAVADPRRARTLVGLAPQEVHLDRFLTAREVLSYHGRYFGMQKADAEARADELLAAFDLEGKAGTRPHRLSGGMRRRLLIARALVHRPRLAILDEPTAGVDLELRQDLWKYLSRLRDEQRTSILLTTHYLEEAEALCHRIAMLKAGRVVALDRTSALLAGTASTMLRFKTDQSLPSALAAQARVTGRIVQLKAHDAAEVEQHLAALRQAGIAPEDLEIGRADLEDVFVQIMSGAHPVPSAPAELAS